MSSTRTDGLAQTRPCWPPPGGGVTITLGGVDGVAARSKWRPRIESSADGELLRQKLPPEIHRVRSRHLRRAAAHLSGHRPTHRRPPIASPPTATPMRPWTSWPHQLFDCAGIAGRSRRRARSPERQRHRDHYRPRWRAGPTIRKSAGEGRGVDLSWLRKHRHHGDNVQAITAPHGWPIWVHRCTRDGTRHHLRLHPPICCPQWSSSTTPGTQ